MYNDDYGRDDFAVKQAVLIVKVLKDAPGSATGSAEHGINREEPLGLQLKRGIAIVARAFDVWWANRNDFADMVRRVHQADLGLQIGLVAPARIQVRKKNRSTLRSSDYPASNMLFRM